MGHHHCFPHELAGSASLQRALKGRDRQFILPILDFKPRCSQRAERSFAQFDLTYQVDNVVLGTPRLRAVTELNWSN